MAKNTMKKNEVSNGVEDKSPGIFQKIFYLLIVPLLFIIGIFVGIASVTDFNIFEKTANLINDSSSEESVDGQDFTEKVVKLEAEVKEKEAQIDQLQAKLESAESEKQQSVTVQEQLQYEIDKLQQEQSETKKEFEDILKSFEQMSAKAAAPILVEMDREEALKILSSMKPDTLSAVLTKMSPEDAADFTEQLSK